MHQVTVIEPKWLSEVAPTFFRVADLNKISKRKQAEKIEPLFDRFATDKDDWVSDVRNFLLMPLSVYQNSGNRSDHLKLLVVSSTTSCTMGKNKRKFVADTTGLIDPTDLLITVDVLQTLAENPSELTEKYTKDVKRATFELHRTIAEGATLGNSLSSKISAALQDYRFTDALVFLFEMMVRGVQPKLGAVQRWVRECDATSSSDGSPGDAEALRCLDLILRIANNSTSNVVVSPKPVFRARETMPNEIPIWHRIADMPKSTATFKKVHHVPGPMRRPPNVYDSTVYASTDHAITLCSTRRDPSRIDVPDVPGAFLILDVFTPEECLQIVQAATTIGFERDQAAEGSARVKSSILARNFIWLADTPFNDHFYTRIKPFVPPTVPSGKVRGINRRYRVYEYTENQLYRPHIDGAWPAAGLHPETGEYLHE